MSKNIKNKLKRTESEQNLHVYISNQITVLETQIKVINKNSYHIDFLNGQILAFKTILSFLESENKDKEIFKEVVNLEIIKKSDLK
jgi:hypothetical protein